MSGRASRKESSNTPPSDTPNTGRWDPNSFFFRMLQKHPVAEQFYNFEKQLLIVDDLVEALHGDPNILHRHPCDENHARPQWMTPTAAKYISEIIQLKILFQDLYDKNSDDFRSIVKHFQEWVDEMEDYRSKMETEPYDDSTAEKMYEKLEKAAAKFRIVSELKVDLRKALGDKKAYKKRWDERGGRTSVIKAIRDVWVEKHGVPSPSQEQFLEDLKDVQSWNYLLTPVHRRICEGKSLRGSSELTTVDNIFVVWVENYPAWLIMVSKCKDVALAEMAAESRVDDPTLEGEDKKSAEQDSAKAAQGKENLRKEWDSSVHKGALAFMKTAYELRDPTKDGPHQYLSFDEIWKTARKIVSSTSTSAVASTVESSSEEVKESSSEPEIEPISPTRNKTVF